MALFSILHEMKPLQQIMAIRMVQALLEGFFLMSFIVTSTFV